MRRRLGLFAVWFLLTAPLSMVLFLHSQTNMVVAGHDAVVSPTLDGRIRLATGPYLPDLRMPSPSRFGVHIVVGKTRAETTDELIQRYVLIANHPDAEIRAVSREIRGLAVDAVLRGALLALAPVALWELVGHQRRRELLRPSVRGAVALVLVAGVGALVVVQPWQRPTPKVQPTSWINLGDAVPELTVPADLAGVQIQGGVLTQNTRKLIASAFDSFDRSKAFYAGLIDKAPGLVSALHVPEEGQTVAVLVSDRHDNIGMDGVVRAVADLAGASAVIDAGDDTSTGESWEAFSLESLDDAFDGYHDRIAVSGNHDHGSFVSGYLKKRGWTHLDHDQTTAFGVRFYGVDDPRSSGLGAYRDVNGPTFAEVEAATADEVCALDEAGDRVATLIVHDANMARTALERGCVDLVVAGHLHVQLGPDRITGSNGSVGYTYTNGTTGGAAYALAVGSKLRREAEFTFVTYGSDGRPAGIQPVRVSTHGDFTVEDYVPLFLDSKTTVSPIPPTDTPSAVGNN